jgi:hypothetical protein
VTVQPASVEVTVTIGTASDAQADAISATFTSLLSSTQAATSVLGVPVEGGTPSVSVVDDDDGDVADGGGDSGGSSSEVNVGIVAGAAAAGGVALLAIYFKLADTYYRRKASVLPGEPPKKPKVSATREGKTVGGAPAEVDAFNA